MKELSNRKGAKAQRRRKGECGKQVVKEAGDVRNAKKVAF